MNCAREVLGGRDVGGGILLTRDGDAPRSAVLSDSDAYFVRFVAGRKCTPAAGAADSARLQPSVFALRVGGRRRGCGCAWTTPSCACG